MNHLPTTRVDFNLTQRHRLSGSYWWQMVNRFPDIQNTSEAQIPGLPNYGNYTIDPDRGLDHVALDAVGRRW